MRRGHSILVPTIQTYFKSYSPRFFSSIANKIKVDIKPNFRPKKVITGSKAWTRRTLDETKIYGQLSPQAVEELNKFVKTYIKSNGTEKLDYAHIDQNLLKTVGTEVKQFEQIIKDKIGFVIIQKVPGLDTIHEMRLGSIAMSNFLGELIVQNAEGVKAILVYDRDHTRYMKDGGRYHQTHEGGSLHTDNVNVPELWDYMILTGLHPPLIGGESIIVSTCSVSNFLLKNAPQVIDTLSQPFLWEYRGFSDSFYRAPIMFYENTNDEPHIRYLREYMESAHNKLNQPLNEKQLFALDALDAVANMSDLQYRFHLNPGDMLLAYDTQVLHGRTAFVDPSPATASYDVDNPKNRLLQRTWAKWRTYT